MPELHELAIDRNTRTAKLLAESSLPKLERLLIDAGDVEQLTASSVDPNYYPALRVLSLCHDRGAYDHWRRRAIADHLELLDFVRVSRGTPSIRRFIIDRLPRSDTAGFLTMVGRAPSPGDWIPITEQPFGLLESQVHRFAHGYVITGDVHLNGRAMQTTELRSMDEVAIDDHVFRFIEDDRARAVADALRVRHGF